MLPLPPPQNYYNDIDSMISTFIWNNKCPRISLTTFQQSKLNGGLSLPNFKYYHWAFKMRALYVWMDQHSRGPWRCIEESLAKPHRLQDLLFTGNGRINRNSSLGCIMSNSLTIWRKVERFMGVPLQICLQTPLWNNCKILIGGKPFCNSFLVLSRYKYSRGHV